MELTDLTCRAVGCRARILKTEIFCARHLAMCQSDVRRVLERKFRPGRKQSHVFDVNLKLAVKEILYYQTEGHHVPRDVEFEF